MAENFDPTIEENTKEESKEIDPYDLDNPALSKRINRLAEIDNSYRSYFWRSYIRDRDDWSNR